MSKVFANSRLILHKGDGLTQVSGPPDVCKTPSPGGPVPLPYPNVAMDSDLADGAKKVKIGGKSVGHAKSNLKTSTGDEAGTAGGGLLSSKTKGKLTFGTSSPNVKIEGQGAVRFLELNQNNGNTFNTINVATGAMMPAYGDDPLDLDDCPLCGEPAEKHRLDPDDEVLRLAGELRDALVAPGGWFRATFRKGSGKPLKKGVMIGALSCQCDNKQYYAGLAGPRYSDGAFLQSAQVFIEEATNLGMIPVVTAPPPPPLSPFPVPPAGAVFGPVTDAQWEAAAARAEAQNEATGRRGNPPLTCAAPKMVQKCLSDGHKPETMIEIWIAMRDGSTVTIPRVWGLVADTTTNPPTIARQLQENLEFGGGDPVPSCTTCQVVLTEMLCNLGQPPCP